MNKKNLIIEICAPSLESAINAEKGGADRIELCAALELGGITPSFAMLKLTKETLSIPINVLIRSRGGDFCYSEHEMQVMLQDVEVCKNIGIEGIVFGALEANGNLQLKQLQRIMKASEGMDFTFHRAFDRCNKPFDAIQQLIDSGVPRVLTSGQQPSALQGATLLAQLIEKTEGKISIMPGAGINATNILTIKEITKAKEFHLSAKKLINSPFFFANAMQDELNYDETDLESVKSVVNLVKK